MDGLKRLIDLRGGIEQIGGGGIVKQLISWY